MTWLGIAMVGAVAWYTFNLARLTWQEGNRGGAMAVGALALTAFLFPTLTLLF